LSDWADLAGKLNQGVDCGVAPAMTLAGWREGELRFCLAAGQAQPETVFDLASLTKPLAAALIAWDLMSAGLFSPETTLFDLWGPAVPPDKQEVSLFRLLNHSAGFCAHQPYFNLIQGRPPSLGRGLVKAMLLNEPLAYQPGEKALYSDLGYMLLGLILEEASGQGLKETLGRVYAKLGVKGPRFLPIGRPLPWPAERIAPCGALPGRGSVHGQVEDENAFALGGVAGHAGLFGTAQEVGVVMAALCRAAAGGGPWPPAVASGLFAVDCTTPGSTRTPGFDTPSGEKSAAGANFPPHTVGHLGFTGVSLWWQPQANAGVVLLTNRVALGRDNQKIGPFRHEIHTLAWPALGF